MKRSNLIGERFGNAVVVGGPVGKDKKGSYIMECQCDCGSAFTRAASHLRSIAKRGFKNNCGVSCPLRGRAVTHGMAHTPQYRVWHTMKARTSNPNSTSWNNYGGRGITVCDRWLESFENFWEDMGPTYAEGLSIERLDNDKGYCPNNCVWKTPSQQARNRRNTIMVDVGSGSITLAEAADQSSVNYFTLYGRNARGVTGPDLIKHTTSNAPL